MLSAFSCRRVILSLMILPLLVLILGYPYPTCCPRRSEASICSSLIYRNSFKTSQKSIRSPCQCLLEAVLAGCQKGLPGYPFSGFLHSREPSPQASGFLHLNSRQRGLLLPGGMGRTWHTMRQEPTSGFPRCIPLLIQGFQVSLIAGSFYSYRARLGEVPSPQQAWEASPGFSGKLRSNLFAFFPPYGLSTFTSKVCWVCTNRSQQHACESSSSFEILVE